MTEDAHQRRKRKWDVGVTAVLPGQGPVAVAQPPATASIQSGVKGGGPLSEEAIKRAQATAAAIFNKISLESVAKGAIPPSKVILAGKGDHEYAREVIINDAPPQVRYNLTKRSTQDDIQRRTGALIVTRGVYCSPGVKLGPDEKPLNLRVTPGATCGQDETSKREAVAKAVKEIEAILAGGTVTHGPVRIGPPEQPHAKVYVAITAPAEFNLMKKLMGEGEAFLRHISSQTGATITLQGQGSPSGTGGGEPLHFNIVGSNQKSVDDASNLANDLLATVRKDYQQFCAAAAYQTSAPPPQQPLQPVPVAVMGYQPPMYPPQYAPGHQGVTVPPGGYPPHAMAPPGAMPYPWPPVAASPAYYQHTPVEYPGYGAPLSGRQMGPYPGYPPHLGAYPPPVTPPTTAPPPMSWAPSTPTTPPGVPAIAATGPSTQAPPSASVPQPAGLPGPSTSNGPSKQQQEALDPPPSKRRFREAKEVPTSSKAVSAPHGGPNDGHMLGTLYSRYQQGTSAVSDPSDRSPSPPNNQSVAIQALGQSDKQMMPPPPPRFMGSSGVSKPASVMPGSVQAAAVVAGGGLVDYDEDD